MVQKTTATGNGSEGKAGEITRGAHYFTPRVDIFETDNELTMYADVPGVNSDNVDLRFERGELILQGRITPRQKTGQALLTEYGEGDFYRVFQIHESIDSTRIEAECKQGVLTVHLPKVEAVKNRKVQVRGE
jgi:HSP20 family protein